jgi:hypothetical protein
MSPRPEGVGGTRPSPPTIAVDAFSSTSAFSPESIFSGAALLSHIVSQVSGVTVATVGSGEWALCCAARPRL